MRKFLTIIIACLLPLAAINAQESESNHKIYVPKKGDFSLGLDLKPVLKYVGNIFNGNTENTLEYIGGEPTLSNLDGKSGIEDKIKDISPEVSIMAKYMLTDNWALRANVGVMIRKDRDNYYVQDDKAVFLDPFCTTKLVDSKISFKNGLSMAVGGEYRRGNKRVQGVFGASALFGFHTINETYNYANALTEVNQNPTTALSETAAPVDGYRILNKKSTNNFFYGAIGSAGVEWFVAPKISLGAEVNLSIYHVIEGQQYTESEGYNTSTLKVDTRYDIDPKPGNSYFRFGTENLGGSIYMSFYF